MTQEIPQNEIRTATHIVSKAGLSSLIEMLQGDRDVLKIEIERDASARIKVTVHFAIMDLPAQLAAVSTRIEKAVAEVNGNRTGA